MKPKQVFIPLTFKDYLNYVINSHPPLARKVHDITLAKHLFNYAKGNCIEVGAGQRNYSNLCDNRKIESYIATDKRKKQSIDACDLPFQSKSLDSVLCFSALEHIENTKQSLLEFNRVLKDRGLVIITTPWFFPFHPAPNDFYRWSYAGLEKEFEDSGFKKIDIKAGGNFFLTMAIFLQRPSWSRNFKNRAHTPLASLALRLMGILFLACGSIQSKKAIDDNYALIYTCVFQKIKKIK